jgi:hypothetical protein
MAVLSGNEGSSPTILTARATGKVRQEIHQNTQAVTKSTLARFAARFARAVSRGWQLGLLRLLQLLCYNCAYKGCYASYPRCTYTALTGL